VIIGRLLVDHQFIGKRVACRQSASSPAGWISPKIVILRAQRRIDGIHTPADAEKPERSLDTALIARDNFVIVAGAVFSSVEHHHLRRPAEKRTTKRLFRVRDEDPVKATRLSSCTSELRRRRALV